MIPEIKQRLGDNPNDREVLKLLLAHTEEILRDEWSSNGDAVTSFVRGWLGLSCPNDRDDLQPYVDAGMASKPDAAH